MGCLVQKLDWFFTRIDGNPALRDATIVLHGDHGSRISAGRFSTTVSARDLIDNHAALYAIRARDIEPGYDLRQVSIQALTAEYFGGRQLIEGAEGDLNVVIDAAVVTARWSCPCRNCQWAHWRSSGFDPTYRLPQHPH